MLEPFDARWQAGLVLAGLLFSCAGRAQQPPAAPVSGAPIAIVPLDGSAGPDASRVTGGLEVAGDKAVIVASGAITAGRRTVHVELPRRGQLRVCTSTTVKLAADSSLPAGGNPGLMMALDHGALEASFATGRNADILLTPDFRILIAGPGAVDLRVRLGAHGDTCVDNGSGAQPTADAPYILVTSVFDGGNYRVQPGQRVMFQHGNIHEVIDQEKESCGCPPPTGKGNDFPLAQSEGLEPTPPPAPSLPAQSGAIDIGQVKLSVNGVERAPAASPPAEAKPPADAKQPEKPAPPPAKKKKGFFAGLGNFFRRIFGAE